jgi:putative DNA primase/helicase
VLLFIYGLGGSGKTTVINAFTSILNTYAIAVAPSTLTAKKYDAHKEELARLDGSRMATASETEKRS